MHPSFTTQGATIHGVERITAIDFMIGKKDT